MLFNTSELMKVSSMMWHFVEAIVFEDEDNLRSALLTVLSEHFTLPLTIGDDDGISLAVVATLLLQGQVCVDCWRCRHHPRACSCLTSARDSCACVRACASAPPAVRGSCILREAPFLL
jgi:hypothetical protein